MLKRIFTVLYRFIWYTFAIIVLNAAVLVTAVRFALPEIGGYKTEIQSWVSEYMNYPVTISAINAEWQGWAPHLYLENIDLYTQDSGQLISRFDAAHIGIDLIASLKQGEIIPHHLSVSGLDLEFTRNVDGSISISSDDKSRVNTRTDNNSALSEWLLKQKYIILENATLSWQDKMTSRSPVQFSNVKLVLRTDKQRIQLDASVALPEQYGQSLKLNADITGNILTPEWDGSIHMAAENVTPSDFFNDLAFYSRDGIANLKLWTSWKKSKLHNFNAELEYKDFSLNTYNYALPVNQAVVKLYGERKEVKDWLLNIKLIDLQTVNGSWPESDYHFKFEKDISTEEYNYSANLAYIKLEEVIPFLRASKALPNDVLEKFDWHSINGELTETTINVNSANTLGAFHVSTNFQDLSLSYNDNAFSISNLAGSLNANNESAKIKLDSISSQLEFASLYKQGLTLSELKSDIEYIYKDIPRLSINDLALSTDDISIKTTGEIRLEEKSPFLDLVMHLDKTNIENVVRYFPAQVSHKLHRWLSKALVAGDILSGDLIFRGYTTDYPFQNAEGNFKALLNLENVTLEYNDGWPPVDKLNAELIFDDNDLLIIANSGYVFDAQINGMSAKINNIDQHGRHVLVNGSLSGHTNDAKHFILQSPLNTNSSLKESAKNISGNIKLDLELDVPLRNKKTSVKGKLLFTDATIESNLPGLGLEDVNGEVHFTRNRVWAEKLDALYHNRPVTLSIPHSEKNNTTKFTLTGLADKTFIANQLNSFFPSLAMNNNINKYYQGESEWSVTIENKKVNNTSHKTVTLNSNLKGINIDLPYPFGKSNTDIRPLKIETKLTNSDIDKIDINYDDNLFVNFIVDNSQDFMVNNILIGLGKEHDQNDFSNNISVQGTLDQLNLAEWKNFFEPNQTTTPSYKDQKTVLFDVSVNKLTMFKNEFDDVHLKLTRPENAWHAIFDSNDIKGQAQLTNTTSTSNKHINIDLEKINIHGSEAEEDKDERLAISDIPELTLNIEKTIYKGIDLGKTELISSNVNDKINIEKLNFTKPGLKVEAKGKWFQIDGVDRSEFTASLTAESVDAMFKTFNYDSANIANGETKIQLNANWMDTPMNFSMDKIDGELDMEIGKGQLLDVDPSAGRLFGLLSIQTLPRRLLLDFTDLFNEGFSFDGIAGNFSLQQGHAYTNDLAMTGPAADIMVSGRTGLITEDYDQIATITPKVSNTLPVASALLGPVGIGVGAVIYLAGELFESIPKQINKVLSYQYSITGSWDDPAIEKIKKDKQSG